MTSCKRPPDGLRARLLVVGLQRDLELGAHQLPDARHQGLVATGTRIEWPARLPGAGDQLLLGAGELAALRVPEGDRLEHRLLGDLP